MYLSFTTVIQRIADESRSGMADAPVVPDEPRRTRRWFRSRRAEPLCEAEPRDRSPKVAGAASAC